MNKLLLLVIFLGISFWGVSQSAEKSTDHRIEIAVDKRVYLIFPAPIYKFDWSEGDSIAVTKDENKILINSFGDEIADSNLLVETEDGYNYSFLLVVKPDIKELKYVVNTNMAFLKRTISGSGKPNVDGSKTTESSVPEKESVDVTNEIRRTANEVENGKNQATGLAKLENKMSFVIGGIFVRGDYLYFKVLIQNESNVPYDIDFIAFVIEREKGKIKRTAVQGPESKKADYILNESTKSIIKGNIVSFVFAFKKFTYDKKETLYVEFWEKNGDRNIRLAIPSREVINAKNI